MCYAVAQVLICYTVPNVPCMLYVFGCDAHMLYVVLVVHLHQLVCYTVPHVLSRRSLYAILVCAILTVCLHSYENIHPSIHPSIWLCVYVSICCTTLTAACPVAACAGAHGRAAPPHAFDNGRAPQHARARVRDPTDGNRLRTLRATRLQKAYFPPKWSVRGGGSIMRDPPHGNRLKRCPLFPQKQKKTHRCSQRI